MAEFLPYDLTYRYDDTLRPIPNNPTEMALAIQYLLEAAANPRGSTVDRVRQLGRAGIYRATLGELDSAEALLNEALELAGALDNARQHVVLRLRLGQVYQWQGRYPEADRLFADEIARCRADARVADYLDFALQHAGKCQFDQGRYEAAIACFREALALREQKGMEESIESTRYALDVAQQRQRESMAG